MNGVLVSQPIGALDCVVHVPPPVVGFHVAEGGVDTALGGHGVGAGGEELGNDSGLESFLQKIVEIYVQVPAGTSAWKFAIACS